MTKNSVQWAAIIVIAALVAVAAGLMAGVTYPLAQAEWVEDGWAVMGDQEELFGAFMRYHMLLALCGLVLGVVLRARGWVISVGRVLGVIAVGIVASHVVEQIAGGIAHLRAATPEGFPDVSGTDLGVTTVQYASGFGTMPATWGIMAFVATIVWWVSEYLSFRTRHRAGMAELDSEGIDAHENGMHRQ